MRSLIEHWYAILAHPILRLELRRIRRKRWRPGRRFFLFYLVLLGATLGSGIILALSDSLEVQRAARVAGVSAVFLLSVGTSVLGIALPWIAPVLTAATIARERELGTLDLLRATLLTGRSIVLGKLGGCAARLWPGMLALALLAPFQVVSAVGSGLLNLSPLLGTDPMFNAGRSWVGVVLQGVAELLKPWGDLALHAAVGMFVSVLCRSSGTAIAVSYGAILVVRVVLWVGQTLFYGLGALWFVSVTPAAPQMVVVPGLASLAIVLVEVVGAVLSVGAAVWWLERM